MSGPGRPRIQLDFPADILERYRSGELDHRDVGQMCGVSPQVALRELRRAGMDTSRSTRKQLQRMRRFQMGDLYGSVRRLYSLGLSLREVADQFDLTPEGVRQILLRYGDEVRTPGNAQERSRTGVKTRRRQLAKRLRTLRTEQHLTRTELAERSSLSRQTITALESGLRDPSTETLLRLAEALDVPLSLLDSESPAKQSRLSLEAAS